MVAYRAAVHFGLFLYRLRKRHSERTLGFGDDARLRLVGVRCLGHEIHVWPQRKARSRRGGSRVEVHHRGVDCSVSFEGHHVLRLSTK